MKKPRLTQPQMLLLDAIMSGEVITRRLQRDEHGRDVGWYDWKRANGSKVNLSTMVTLRRAGLLKYVDTENVRQALPTNVLGEENELWSGDPSRDRIELGVYHNSGVYSHAVGYWYRWFNGAEWVAKFVRLSRHKSYHAANRRAASLPSSKYFFIW